VWTVDTLYLPFNPFTGITGTSPQDVWAIGPGGDADKTIYHFDGQIWQTDLIPRPFSPLAAYSLNKNSVWSSGLQGKIWNYNGNEWNEHYRLYTGGDTLVIFQDIFALSETDIYAVGQYFINAQDYWGIILHYSGNNWEEIIIPKTRTLFEKIRKNIDGKIYLRGLTQQDLNENDYQLYELNDMTFKKIKSGSQNNDELGNILHLGSETYFIIGYDFFSYNGSSFTKIGRLSDSPKFMNAGIGRNVKDIFLGMRDGIAHYNGENTIYLYQSSENVFVRLGIIFEKEVFFLGRDVNGNNLIFHGKLNE